MKFQNLQDLKEIDAIEWSKAHVVMTDILRRAFDQKPVGLKYDVTGLLSELLHRIISLQHSVAVVWDAKPANGRTFERSGRITISSEQQV